MSRWILLISVIIAASGCAITKEDLKNHPENSQSAIVEAAYEDVVERIMDRATVCFQWSIFGPTVSMVQNQFNPRTKTANVSVMTLASGITRVWLTVDMRALSESRTEIIAFTHGNSEREKNIKTRITRDWGNGLSRECP